MPSQAISPKKSLAVTEVSLDDLFKQMSEWFNRIAKRAYGFFAASGFTNGHDLEHWFTAERELLKPITLEVKEGTDEFIVRAEVPGFEADDLHIHLNGSHLVIEGKHESTEEKKEKERTINSERKCEQIYRSIELPSGVLAENAHADLKNGVLEVKLSKPVKAKQIKIAAA